MKLREITQEQRNKYLNDIQSIILDYSDMVKEVNKKLVSYGVFHYKQTQNIITLSFAKQQKEPLLVEMKNINTSTLDKIISNLKGLKDKYIKEIAPVTAITDQLELSFIEKELKVMSDEELIQYYKENYLDTNICRLIHIEHKDRNNHKEGKTLMPLQEYEVDDYISKQIDNAIRTLVGLRQVVSINFCIQELNVDAVKVVMVPWNRIIEETEKRNLTSITKVTVDDIYKSNMNL